MEEIRRKTIPIAKQYGVAKMSLWGSYARGDAGWESDIDILIDRGKMRGMLQYFAFVYALEDALKCHVDVVTSGMQDKNFLGKITRDAVMLYEG